MKGRNQKRRRKLGRKRIFSVMEPERKTFQKESLSKVTVIHESNYLSSEI